ncbi:MAG: TIGR01458 family HAD-type hydrolase [Pseudomonadales bacterium]
MHGFLIDLDGVVYDGDRAIPGAADAIAFLHQHHLPHLFLTNISSVPARVIWQKLRFLGIDIPLQSILTPMIAAREWIRANGREPVAAFVPRATLADFEGLNVLPQYVEAGARAIVIGDLGDQWDYQKLNRAFRLLEHGDDKTCLVALGMTRYCKAEDGRLRLDVAPFVKALEHSSAKQPVVMGKPAVDFFQQAADRLSLPMSELIMVGDDIYSDVHGAQRCGMQGVLVKTGKFREQDLASEVRPDAIVRSLADLPKWIREQAWSDGLHEKPFVSKLLDTAF